MQMNPAALHRRRHLAPAGPGATPSTPSFLNTPIAQYLNRAAASGNPFASPGSSVLDTLASFAASPQLSCSLYIKNLPSNADKLFL
jgi:hypothetical protein